MDERASRIDDYILKKKLTQQDYTVSLNYLSQLQLVLQRGHTISEIRLQIRQFIQSYDVPQEVLDCLLQSCQELGSEDEIHIVCSSILDFIENLVEKRKETYKKSEAETQNVQENVIDYFHDQLGSVGVQVQGEHSEIESKIQSEKDVEQLKNNLDVAIDYLKNRQQFLGRSDVDTSISTDQVIPVTEGANDHILLDTILSKEKVDSSSVQVDTDGSLVIQASLEEEESMDFAKMMVVGLMTSNSDSFFSNLGLDMILQKGENDKNSFCIKFGNFSNLGKGNFASDPMVRQKLSDLIDSFQVVTDYSTMLEVSSPELALVFQLLEDHILQKEGMAQIAVQNVTGDLNFSFGLGEQYDQLADALMTNGALTTQTPTGSYLCNVNETTPGNSLMVLSSTHETLSSLNTQNEVGYQSQRQYVKALDDRLVESGNVSPYILTIILLFGVSVALFLAFLFSGK